MNTLSPAITLTSSELRCVIRPDLGGSIESFAYCSLAGDLPILAPLSGRADTAPHKIVRDMGCFPLVPFSNRIAKAQLKWNGTDHPLVKMGTTEEHAMHGVAWQRAWQVLESNDDFAMLSYEQKADSAWPFAFDVSQTFKLSGNVLTLMLSITNQHSGDAPAGLGWHPQFVKRPNSHLQFDSASRWEMGEDKLPTRLQAMSGVASPCADLDVDHCYEGWTGLVDLKDDQLVVRVESNLNRLVVFTNSNKAFVALEPVSHANNAINLAGASVAALEELGMRVLASGETLTAQMSITVSKST